LASCCVIDEPPCTTPLRLDVGRQRAQGAREVDAEMLVEAPVLGREHGLDQMVGKFLERHRVVVADAALAELVAVAVEEGDGELRTLEPVLVGGFVKGGDGERKEGDRAHGCEREAFGDRLDAEPLYACDIEAVHEGGIVVVFRAQPSAGGEQRMVDARVEVEQAALEPPDLGLFERGLFRLGAVAAAAAEEQGRLSL
jgi:hypothetical protein